jgi:NAD/NADP transhydrogenase beta subunit
MPKPTAKPEVLPPSRYGAQINGRFVRANRLFRDENLDLLAHVLDELFRIPGTSIRFGLDGIIGLVPGIGDVLVGLASCILLLAAWVRGVPYVTLARMLVNVSIGVLVGSIPILGDAFDIAWKANRRNYALMTRHIDQPHRHTWRDWLFLLAIAVVFMSILAAPIVVLLWILHWLLVQTWM